MANDTNNKPDETKSDYPPASPESNEQETPKDSPKPDAPTQAPAKPAAKEQESKLKDNQVGAGNDAGNTPGKKEMLESAGTASPHAPNAGLKDGTEVLGAESNRSDDVEDARREALSNARGEQDLH